MGADLFGSGLNCMPRMAPKPSQTRALDSFVSELEELRAGDVHVLAEQHLKFINKPHYGEL